MNLKNLIEVMATVVATIAVCGCVSPPSPQHTADMRQPAATDLGITRNVWAKCVRAAIPGLDDGKSTSEVVARAAMNRCSDEYADMTRAVARNLAPTCSENSQCTSGALAKAQREATKAATDDVVDARVRAAAAQVLKCQ